MRRVYRKSVRELETSKPNELHFQLLTVKSRVDRSIGGGLKKERNAVDFDGCYLPRLSRRAPEDRGESRRIQI